MIFISKDHNGQIMGIVSAADIKSVNAFYQGQEDLPYTTEEFPINRDSDNEKMGYVTPILKTTEIDVHNYCHNHKVGAKVRIQIK